jgi:hypothetical protein
MNVTPRQHHNAENAYSLTKDFISIFRDGTYTISYDDIFGRSYQDEKVVETGIDLNLSMSGMDSAGKYTLFAEPVENEGKVFLPAKEGQRITLFADKYNASLFDGGYTRFLTATRATVQYGQSETAIIALMWYSPYYDGWFLDHDKPIVIIDGETRKNPEITVHWYYHEFGSDAPPQAETQTDNRVDVWITSDLSISGVNGKLLTHSFSFGENESYTFEYESNEGITGSITVSLPISIVESKQEKDRNDIYIHDPDTGVDEETLDQQPPDTTEPSAIFSIYGSFGSIMKSKGDWHTWSSDSMEPLFTWASTFIIKANIIDESKTKIVLLQGEDASAEGITYNNAISSDIQGVEFSGGNIQVTGQVTDPLAMEVAYPEAFTVLLIDEADNKKTISFPAAFWSQLDVIAPSIDTLEYEKTGFTTVDALFSLRDDKTPADQIRLISPTGLSYDVDTGVYTMSFTENSEVEIAMRDLAGNVGAGYVSVMDIDDSPPTAAVSWWSKGLYNVETGVYDPANLTDEKTNQTITAKIVFDKAVKDITLHEIFNNDYNTVQPDDHGMYVTLSVENDAVYINFIENCSVTLKFSGLNDKENSFSLDVTNLIDKVAPSVTVDKNDLNTETMATVTFRGFNEPVHAYGPGETGKLLLPPGDEIIKTFTQKGTYIFRFTDEAGNTTTEKVSIENIDEYPPGILLSDLPEAGIYCKGAVTFKATMSEEGTLTFNGVTQSVTAPTDANGNGEIDDDECDWVSFTAAQNGNYAIVAQDIAGRKTTAYVPIRCIDNTGPIVSFSPATITVLSGTDAGSMSELLEQGVECSDNSTAKEDITLTHETLTDVQLSIPGLYQLVYTAVDQAGNESGATRYVKVFSADEISVVINGKRTEQKGTVQLHAQQVTLEVSKLPLGDNEPYKVYLRKGIWTAGLMKGIQALVQPESFTLPERDCFYTLYIVTQNRGTYLTYLYIQD